MTTRDLPANISTDMGLGAATSASAPSRTGLNAEGLSASTTQPEGDLPGTGEMRVSGPSRTAGNLPAMPAPQSTLPGSGPIEVGMGLDAIRARAVELARPASPDSAI